MKLDAARIAATGALLFLGAALLPIVTSAHARTTAKSPGSFSDQEATGARLLDVPRGLTGASERAPAAASTPTLGGSLPPRLPESKGRVFYVSPSGSDSDAGSAERPWKTVQKAFDTLEPGQTALVRGGVYSANHFVERAGTPSAPITVEAYPGQTPVLHADPSSPSYPLRIRSGAAYVRISGFVIENAPVPDNVNVYVMGGAHHIEISHNEIRNAVDASGLFTDSAARDIYILWNRVHHNNEPGHQHQGIYVQSSNSVIGGNLAYGHTDGFGIQVRDDEGTGPSNVLIAGNTVVENSEAGIVVEDSARETKIVNNVVVFNGRGGIRGYDSGDPIGRGNVAWNNLAYGNGDDDCMGNAIIDCRINFVASRYLIDRLSADYRQLQAAGSGHITTPAYADLADLDARLRELRHTRAGG